MQCNPLSFGPNFGPVCVLCVCCLQSMRGKNQNSVGLQIFKKSLSWRASWGGETQWHRTAGLQLSFGVPRRRPNGVTGKFHLTRRLRMSELEAGAGSPLEKLVN